MSAPPHCARQAVLRGILCETPFKLGSGATASKIPAEPARSASCENVVYERMTEGTRRFIGDNRLAKVSVPSSWEECH